MLKLGDRVTYAGYGTLSVPWVPACQGHRQCVKSTGTGIKNVVAGIARNAGGDRANVFLTDWDDQTRDRIAVNVALVAIGVVDLPRVPSALKGVA